MMARPPGDDSDRRPEQQHLVDELVADVTAVLHARGERMTGPRRAVLACLAEADGHRSAEDVVAAVASHAPEVHRASVYRALEALADAEVVQHVHLGHGATAYHLAHQPHLHLQCRSCGLVLDVPARLLDGVARRLRRDQGFVLDPGHVALSGTCVDCRPPDG